MTTTTPPAGMRWREVPVGPTESPRRYSIYFDGGSWVVWSAVSSYRGEFASLSCLMRSLTAVDWPDAVVRECIALTESNIEPAPPAPVERDATWKAVSGLVDSVWNVAKSYERYGNMDAFPAWDGTQAVTDAILRAVQDRIDTVESAHRADREAVLSACGVTKQTVDTLAGEVREAIERADRAAQLLPGWWSLHDIKHNVAYQCDTQERAQNFSVNGDRCRLVSRLALVSEETKADDSDTSDTNTTNQRQYRWVGERLEVRYPSESTWKEEYQIPVDRLHEIIAMRHAPAAPRGVE